ncbi:hypothetical protein SERLA73DRAFT_142964, partial [Serpula lacrymans var. lacrymans S7.3]
SSTTTASSSRHKLFSEPLSQRKVPQTPLDSLLSAARSMMDDEEEESIGSTATNGSVRRLREFSSHDIPESPLPKRRKIAPALIQ